MVDGGDETEEFDDADLVLEGDAGKYLLDSAKDIDD